MTLNSKNNHANEISVRKLVKNEVLHKIVGILYQKLKIQDGRQKPWIYANKHIKEAKSVSRDRCMIMWPMQWSCDAKHGIPRNHPLLWGKNKFGGLLVPGGLLVNTWQMTT